MAGGMSLARGMSSVACHVSSFPRHITFQILIRNRLPLHFRSVTNFPSPSLPSWAPWTFSRESTLLISYWSQCHVTKSSLDVQSGVSSIEKALEARSRCQNNMVGLPGKSFVHAPPVLPIAVVFPLFVVSVCRAHSLVSTFREESG